jgi:hypothetical protein
MEANAKRNGNAARGRAGRRRRGGRAGLPAQAAAPSAFLNNTFRIDFSQMSTFRISHNTFSFLTLPTYRVSPIDPNQPNDETFRVERRQRASLGLASAQTRRLT